MDFHNPIDEIIGNCILVPNIVANVSVIYLSLRRVKSSMMQKFALNLCVPSLAFSIYSITVFSIKHLNKYEELVMDIKIQRNTFLDRTADFILYVCAYDYQMLVISLVAITYMAFAKPLFVQERLGGWAIHVIFIICHATALLMAVAAMSSEDQTEVLVYHTERKMKDIDWTDITEAVFCLVSFTILITLYFVCIKAVIGFSRRNSVASQGTKDRRKKQLHAILAYITPPNLLVIPTSICVDLLAVLLSQDTPVFKQICQAKVVFHDTLLASRLFISSAGILIAFPDYRNALKEAFCLQSAFKRVVRTISI
uniref:G protein-coupled receptor n=1 Tax=Steinernema glaseri TaxID=37863 RepID=A0A1I7YN16_9BILA